MLTNSQNCLPKTKTRHLENEKGVFQSFCCKAMQYPLFFNGQCWSPDLRYDWRIKKATVDLPITLKENLQRTSGNLLTLLGAQNRDIRAAS